MKKIIINVTSFILIVLAMAIMNRTTVRTVEITNRVWCNNEVTYNRIERETRLITGEVVSTNECIGLTEIETLKEFLIEGPIGIQFCGLSFR